MNDNKHRPPVNQTKERGGMETPMKLMSPRGLAVALDLPLSWIYAQAERGALPHYKCGKYLRFELGEVEAWLQRHKRGGSGQDA
jgi:excisionase family DNA binding protein